MTSNVLHPARDRKNEAPDFSFEPIQFEPEHSIVLKGLGQVKLRPIRIDDEKRMIAFHGTLSEESIYLRYFEHIALESRTLHERLAKVCANTADSFAIVAETPKKGARASEIIAVGRLTTTELPTKAAFALLIADRANETGLAAQLLKRLMVIARTYRFHELAGDLLVGDYDEVNLCRDLGFKLHTIQEDGIVRVLATL